MLFERNCRKNTLPSFIRQSKSMCLGDKWFVKNANKFRVYRQIDIMDDGEGEGEGKIKLIYQLNMKILVLKYRIQSRNMSGGGAYAVSHTKVIVLLSE